MWIVADLLNLVILARVIYRTKKDTGYVNIGGCIHLVVFSMIFGPMFTVICGLAYALERIE